MIGVWERSPRTVLEDNYARVVSPFFFFTGFFEMFLARGMPAC